MEAGVKADAGAAGAVPDGVDGNGGGGSVTDGRSFDWKIPITESLVRNVLSQGG